MGNIHSDERYVLKFISVNKLSDISLSTGPQRRAATTPCVDHLKDETKVKKSVEIRRKPSQPKTGAM